MPAMAMMRPPKQVAVKCGDKEWVSLLPDHCIDVDAWACGDDTALHLATEVTPAKC